MSKLTEYTNSMLEDFFSFCGREMGKECLQMDEYLLFRNQAMKEIKAGFNVSEQIIETSSYNTNKPLGCDIPYEKNITSVHNPRIEEKEQKKQAQVQEPVTKDENNFLACCKIVED